MTYPYDRTQLQGVCECEQKRRVLLRGGSRLRSRRLSPPRQIRHDEMNSRSAECIIAVFVESARESESGGDDRGNATARFAVGNGSAIDVDNATLCAHALRNSSNMRLNSAGRSAIALCAASGITTRR